MVESERTWSSLYSRPSAPAAQLDTSGRETRANFGGLRWHRAGTSAIHTPPNAPGAEQAEPRMKDLTYS